MLGNKADALLKENVVRELKWDPRVEETEIGVEVKSGIVTLSGFVNGWGKKEAAARAAHRVKGVLDVANELKVTLGTEHKRTDADIAKAVRAALEWDIFVPDKQIQSTVSDGMITLSGSVERLTQKVDAERAVRNLAGVRGVFNDLVVTHKADAEEVKRSIQSALERYALHEAKRVTISVTDAEVKLTGAVRTWNERRAIVGAAHGTPGVKRVIDQIRVDAT